MALDLRQYVDGPCLVMAPGLDVTCFGAPPPKSGLEPRRERCTRIEKSRRRP